LRFYDKINSLKAKNLIPSLSGSKINAIDSTQDGHLILLTYSDFLLLIPTWNEEENKEYNLFRDKLKNSLKPTPLKLIISPYHA